MTPIQRQAEFLNALADWTRETYEVVMEDPNFQITILKQIETIDSLNTIFPEEQIKNILHKTLELSMIIARQQEQYHEFVKLNTL